jgi:hypothetical protein
MNIFVGSGYRSEFSGGCPREAQAMLRLMPLPQKRLIIASMQKGLI